MTQASVDTVQNSVSAHFQRPTLARSTVDSNQSGALCVAAAIVRRQLTEMSIHRSNRLRRSQGISFTSNIDILGKDKDCSPLVVYI